MSNVSISMRPLMHNMKIVISVKGAMIHPQ